MRVLVATREDVLVVDPSTGAVVRADTEEQPTSLTVDPSNAERVWCGTEAGVLRSDDAGTTWALAGLEDEEITAIVASPNERGASGAIVYAGTEPSAVWRSADGGGSWQRAEGLLDLPSSSTWSFPPRPETHHVRWIACDPAQPGRLYVAVEAGALVTTPDGGKTWQDRPKVAPFDTHELAIHSERPEVLRVSAGDGYWESADGGGSWSSPEDGLEVTYLRSVAIDPGDPGVVVVSAASHAHAAYMAGRSDGRLYRREGKGTWERVTAGWPDPPATIAPLLSAGGEPGELWAADERGVHRSTDGGRAWEPVAAFDPTPAWLRGLAVVGGA
ncbi:MAG: WD40/YVTN/BNR-like repeat-containing protein [Gemmatimonadota bacterium]